jgi:L-rhamnose mutarotase
LIARAAKPYAWVLGVKPGYEAEYERRHVELWPEMGEALDRAGISTYHIFRHGLTLFGYFECADIAATMATLAQCPVNARWAEYMAPIMTVDIDPATQFPYLLPHQFNFVGGDVLPLNPLPVGNGRA